MVKRDRAPQGVEPVKSEDGNDEVEEEGQSFLRKYVRAKSMSAPSPVAFVLILLLRIYTAVVHRSAYRCDELIRRGRRRACRRSWWCSRYSCCRWKKIIKRRDEEGQSCIINLVACSTLVITTSYKPRQKRGDPEVSLESCLYTIKLVCSSPVPVSFLNAALGGGGH